MPRLILGMAGAAVLGVVLAADGQQAAKRVHAQPAVPAPAMAVSHTPAATSAMSPDAMNKLVAYYCSSCHDDEGKSGGLSLEHFDATRLYENAEVTEKMIRKLRAGMMPPPAAKERPDAATATAFAASLEARIDEVAATHVNPGRRTFQRLNRAEYERAIRDLLDLDVDVNAFLPPDTISHGFDNIADSQTMSPTLMEGYLRAASKISSLALGDRAASPTEATFKVPRTQSQMQHVEGTPWGTRGGLSLVHTFPADGEYSFRIMLHGVPTGQLYGSTTRGEQVEVAINGERVALMDINYRMTETDKAGLNLTTPRIHVKAGPQHITAAFIQRFDGPVDDLMAPIDYTLADTEIGDSFGITTLPHLRDFSITGPFKVTGVSDTPSRRNVFTCRPTSATDETACAAEIVKRLASRAYRAPASADDV